MSVLRFLPLCKQSLGRLVACGLIATLCLGCETKPAADGKPADSHSGSAPASHAGDDHGHGDAGHGDAGHHEGDGHEGHDHSHEGVHGGHVVVLEPGHLHAEWVHLDEEEIVEVYVLDKPEDVTKVQFVVKVKDQESVTYELAAAPESLGPGGYMLKNPLLLTGIQMADGEANTTTLQVETKSGMLEAAIKDDHDHAH